jgi:hypothetical protein
MPKPSIQEFAKALIENVRDAAIQNSDMVLRPDVTFSTAKRWREAARNLTAEDFAKVVIPDVVDKTIASLLRAIDEGSLKLHFSTSDGRIVDLEDEGLSELTGWFMGSGGWREQFSRERFVDDFKDLNK